MGVVKPTFSVIIPTFNRREVNRAILSLISQGYPISLYEIIVVDDGSNEECLIRARISADTFQERGFNISIIEHGKNLGKTFARNTGLRAATKEWICELDSDDEYHSHYLENFAEAIQANPNVNVFTCGAAVYNHKSKTFNTRPAFVPKKGEVFGSGRIGTGSFVYRRSLQPYIPESAIAYGSDDSFSALVQKKYPEIRAMYGQNEQGQWKPFGSPFADDYTKFFILTRENDTVGINLPLYLQNYRV